MLQQDVSGFGCASFFVLSSNPVSNSLLDVLLTFLVLYILLLLACVLAIVGEPACLEKSQPQFLWFPFPHWGRQLSMFLALSRLD